MDKGAEDDYRKMVADDSICKETVNSLKEICKDLGLACTGKKEDINNRIKTFFK